MMVENDETADTTPMAHSELHTDDTDDAMETEWMQNADAFSKTLQEKVSQDTLMRGKSALLSHFPHNTPPASSQHWKTTPKSLHSPLERKPPLQRMRQPYTGYT